MQQETSAQEESTLHEGVVSDVHDPPGERLPVEHRDRQRDVGHLADGRPGEAAFQVVGASRHDPGQHDGQRGDPGKDREGRRVHHLDQPDHSEGSRCHHEPREEGGDGRRCDGMGLRDPAVYRQECRLHREPRQEEYNPESRDLDPGAEAHVPGGKGHDGQPQEEHGGACEDVGEVASAGGECLRGLVVDDQRPRCEGEELVEHEEREKVARCANSQRQDEAEGEERFIPAPTPWPREHQEPEDSRRRRKEDPQCVEPKMKAKLRDDFEKDGLHHFPTKAANGPPMIPTPTESAARTKIGTSMTRGASLVPSRSAGLGRKATTTTKRA